jgi:ATP-dependent Lon protease
MSKKVHRSNTDYSVNIKVSEEVYERWKDRLELRNIYSYGHKSKITIANKYLYERAVNSITDDQLDRLVKDLLEG